MIVGIEIKTNYGITSIVDEKIIRNYTWQLRDVEGIYGQDCFYKDKGHMSGDELYSFLSDADYRLITGIFVGGAASFLKSAHDLVTMQDYLMSNMQILIIITDCNCLEVYLKNHEELDKVIQNIQQMHEDSADYVHLDNLHRKHLCVY